MGRRKATISSLLIFLFILSSVCDITFGSSANWVEVIRFEGNESTKTEPFTCDNVEWRIRWEYVPSLQPIDSIFFSVFTYPREEGVRGSMYVNSIMEIGDENENGTSYVHEHKGTFFMIINVIGTENYTIIVEQNNNSIPEFHSWAPLFVLVVSVVVLTVVFRRRLPKNHQRGRD